MYLKELDNCGTMTANQARQRFILNHSKNVLYAPNSNGVSKFQGVSAKEIQSQSLQLN